MIQARPAVDHATLLQRGGDPSDRSKLNLTAGRALLTKQKGIGMSLQTALQEHCHESLNRPMAAVAPVDGIESLGFSESLAVESTLSGILQFVTSWLKTSGALPPKQQVLDWVEEAFNEHIAVRPPFAGHKIITQLARQGLLTFVSSAYDAI